MTFLPAIWRRALIRLLAGSESVALNIRHAGVIESPSPLLIEGCVSCSDAAP